jgi:general secretion pathway protein D
MEASSTYTRKLTAAIAPTGFNVPVTFNPRPGLAAIKSSTGSSGSIGDGTGTGLGTTTTPTTTTSNSIPLSALGHLSSSDWSIILPDALLQAVLSDASTKVLESPQLRSVDSQKATLKIGDRRPTATGSFQPGIGGVGINPLVNTQFTYIDVGVNVDLTPRVHENGEISMHAEIEISNVSGTVNLGGIDQPIIGQRKVIHDIRMRDGEVNLLGGLINQQDTKTKTGTPGLASLPIIGRLFSGEEVDRNRAELMIAIIPHIVRRTEITPQNLKTIAVGNATVVKLNYAARQPEPAPAAAPPAPGQAAQPAAAPVPAAGAAAAPPPAPAATPPANTAPVTPAPKPVPLGGPPAIAPVPTGPPGAPPPPPPPPAAAEQKPAAPVVVFAPSALDAQLSGAITVTLLLTGGQDVFAAPMQIQYDPKVLRLNDVARGPLLSSDGQQVVFTKNIMNDAGTATVNLNRFPGSKGVSGSGTLVTLTFQAVGRGSTTVSVPNLTVRDSQGATLATATPTVTVNVK